MPCHAVAAACGGQSNNNMQDFDYRQLVVVYEDNHIIVVVKPQNVPTQADESGDYDMLRAVKDYLIETYHKPGEAYVGLVHRLDRPTGGVMVFAKTSKAAKRLCEQIKDNTFEKKYVCVTCAEPKTHNGNLVHYLKKDEARNQVRIVPQLTEGAKRAELDYAVVDTVKGFSLVKVMLHTGRSHQIRVQMASIGCPLFGDAKYGADPKTCKYPLALWAYEIRFLHPVTQEKRSFIVYPPKEEIPWRAYDISRFLNVGIAASPYERNAANIQIGSTLPDRK